MLKVEERLGDGLAVLTVEFFGVIYHGQLWSKVTARKHGTCWRSGRDYVPGAEVYRPFGNERNRSQRILADMID